MSWWVTITVLINSVYKVSWGWNFRIFSQNAIFQRFRCLLNTPLSFTDEMCGNCSEYFRYKPNSSFVRLPTIRRPNLRDVLYKSPPPPAPSAICSSIPEAGRDGNNDVTGKWLITDVAKNSSGYLLILTVDTLVTNFECVVYFDFIHADEDEEQPDYIQLTHKHKVAIRAIRRVNY